MSRQENCRKRLEIAPVLLAARLAPEEVRHLARDGACDLCGHLHVLHNSGRDDGGRRWTSCRLCNCVDKGSPDGFTYDRRPAGTENWWAVDGARRAWRTLAVIMVLLHVATLVWFLR